MRRSEKYMKRCSLRGKESQRAQENKRLVAALEYGPIRSVVSTKQITGTTVTMFIWTVLSGANSLAV